MNRLANVDRCVGVRASRTSAGERVCFGSGVCLEPPSEKCARGLHDVCNHHGENCFLCREQDLIVNFWAEWPKNPAFKNYPY